MLLTIEYLSLLNEDLLTHFNMFGISYLIETSTTLGTRCQIRIRRGLKGFFWDLIYIITWFSTSISTNCLLINIILKCLERRLLTSFPYTSSSSSSLSKTTLDRNLASFLRDSFSLFLWLIRHLFIIFWLCSSASSTKFPIIITTTIIIIILNSRLFTPIIITCSSSSSLLTSYTIRNLSLRFLIFTWLIVWLRCSSKAIWFSKLLLLIWLLFYLLRCLVRVKIWIESLSIVWILLLSTQRLLWSWNHATLSTNLYFVIVLISSFIGRFHWTFTKACILDWSLGR